LFFRRALEVPVFVSRNTAFLSVIITLPMPPLPSE
jgi:hypothetical protein